MNDLTDQEKSVLLAKARGWTVRPRDGDPFTWFLIDENDNVLRHKEFHYADVCESDVWRIAFSFYDSANMVLAWRCHLWMLHREIERETGARDGPYTKWCKGMFPWWSDAVQELFLDKILSLLSR